MFVLQFLLLKPGSHLTVMTVTIPAAVSQAEHDLPYLRLVPCTAGRVQFCLRYRWYRTHSGKSNVMSHAEVEFFVVRLQTGRKKARNKQFLQTFSSPWLSKTQTKEKSSGT